MLDSVGELIAGVVIALVVSISQTVDPDIDGRPALYARTMDHLRQAPARE
jgi:hypothetical protein